MRRSSSGGKPNGDFFSGCEIIYHYTYVVYIHKISKLKFHLLNIEGPDCHL